MTGFSKFNFLRRVRIHDGECGAVARALHHEIEALSLSAVDKKVLSTTNERKVMSKKTFFKRIAISAIAALGLGLLSVAPSQSTVSGHTLTIDANDTVNKGDSATATLTHVFTAAGTASASDSVTVRALFAGQPSGSTAKIFLSVTDSYTGAGDDATAENSPQYSFGYTPAETATGITTLPAHESLTTLSAFPTNAYSAIFSSGRESLTVAPDQADSVNTSKYQLKLYGANVAGTYTINVFTQVNSAGSAASTASTPSVTWTVTVSETDAAATAASSATVRYADTAVSTGTAEGTDSTTLHSAYDILATDTTPEATVWYRLKTGLSPNTAKESITVTVAGEAFITTTTSAASRPAVGTGVKSLSLAVPTADAYVGVEVWSTGTAGTATVSATTASGVALTSKTLTFHGAPTTITNVVQYKKVIQANKTSAETSVIAVKVTDAGGRAVVGYTPGIVGSNAQAASTGSCADTTADSSTRDGTFVCSVTVSAGSTSGMTSTMTARLDDPEVAGTQYTITSTFDVTLGGAISTVVLTTDKATYEPGEWMIITATAKDSSGNTPYDGQTGPTLTANKSLGTTISMNLYYDGKSTSQTRSSTDPRTFTNSQTISAPAASGKFRISGTDNQTVPAAISVEATVGDDAATAAANAASDAALEAIDAANAATDAANLAAEAADAATVAAEEARDAADAATAAVEALATEVATLMAALKAQITTLANTVAKIAKKVKA